MVDHTDEIPVQPSDYDVKKDAPTLYEHVLLRLLFKRGMMRHSLSLCLLLLLMIRPLRRGKLFVKMMMYCYSS